MNVTVTQMQQHVAASLSMRSRIAYTMLLVAAAAMAGLTGALAATEPNIPLRTTIALTLMSGIGIVWAGIAVWVLARRRVLFAQDRVVVSSVAAGVCGMFVLGAMMLQSPLRYPTIGVAIVMLAIAIGCLAAARRHRAQLVARRDALLTSQRP